VEKVSEELSSQFIEILKNELEVKNNQLEMQNKQIIELTNALIVSQQTATAAQALHAGTMQQNLIDREQEKTQGFIARIFAKRK
jgi:hypothetical protein